MIKGILFDKDGTLIKFHKQWVTATLEFVHRLHRNVIGAGNEQELLRRIGIVDGKAVEGGLIASGSTADLARVLSLALNISDDQMLQSMRDFYYNQLLAHPEYIEPIGDLPPLFRSLKARGYALGVATGDDYLPTFHTMKQIGILPYLDFIGTSDRFKEKPAADMAHAFCGTTGLSPDEVVHVGDTEVDMQFAARVAFGIGVCTGVCSRNTLDRWTDHVLASVHELLDTDSFLLLHNS